MSGLEFSLSPVTSRDQFDKLRALVRNLIGLFPEDRKLLVDALYGLERNRQSLIGVGGFDGDICTFFVISLDDQPSLQVIYVPPELRNQRLGSNLFVFMAMMMKMEKIPNVRIRTTPACVRFFERFGAEVVPVASPAPHEWTLMDFDPDNLKRPENWFEGQINNNQESVS